MIGTRRPAAQALGSPRRRRCRAGRGRARRRPGWCAAASCRASSPVARQVDLVAAGPQVDRRARGGSAVRRRRRGRGSRRRLQSARTMVRPPPGVSSTSMVPPIASTKPLATARPSPTPVAARPVAEPLEGLEDALPLVARERRARGRRPGRRPRPDTARTCTRTGSPRGRQATALATMLATARSSSAGSADDRRQVSGTSTTTPVGPRPRGSASAPATTSSRPMGRQGQRRRPGLQPAHVEEVPDQRVEPVGLLVDGGQELARVASSRPRRRRPGRRLVTDALMAAQRRAQVVGHGGEDAGAQFVDGAPGLRRRRLRLQLAGSTEAASSWRTRRASARLRSTGGAAGSTTASTC